MIFDLSLICRCGTSQMCVCVLLNCRRSSGSFLGSELFCSRDQTIYELLFSSAALFFIFFIFSIFPFFLFFPLLPSPQKL